MYYYVLYTMYNVLFSASVERSDQTIPEDSPEKDNEQPKYSNSGSSVSGFNREALENLSVIHVRI
jgi:hypothetical protein